MSYTNYCCTCCFLLLLFFLITYLGKKQFHHEPFVISGYVEPETLLDQPTSLKISKSSYSEMQKYKPKSTMSSFEQTTNNEPYTQPSNGSILLPELNGFY
jgi:hypothetical protein